MRRLLLALALTVGLAGCGAEFGVVVTDPGPVVVTPLPPTPGYVYLYPTDACWADDLYYEVCPWTFTAGYGFYRFHAGGWFFYDEYVWSEYGNPPPREWFRQPPDYIMMHGRRLPMRGSQWRGNPPPPHINTPAGRSYAPPAPRPAPPRGGGGWRGHR